MPRGGYASVVDSQGNVLAGVGAPSRYPQFSDPNQALSWLDQAGNSLPLSQWQPLHDQAVRAQTMGTQMPQAPSDSNMKAGVSMLSQLRTGQEIGQSAASFPLEQQKLLLGNQKTGQEISQASQSFPLSQQQAVQTLGQGAADFRLRQQAGQLANENGIAAQYGAETGQILNTLAKRHLTRDPATQNLAEAKPGDPIWARDALSFYIEPKYVPGQNGLPGTTTPGRMAQITEQDAHSLLDAANARVQVQRQQPQGGMQEASYQPGYGPSARQNTGWGIFGNEGNAGDYHTFHLQDEANAAGMSPQGYLASILQRQMGGGGGSAPAMTGGFQMPANPHDEFADLSSRRTAALGGTPGVQQAAAPGYALGSAADPLRSTPSDVLSNGMMTSLGASSPLGLMLANRMALQSPEQVQQDQASIPTSPQSAAAAGLAFRNAAPGYAGAGMDAAYHGVRQGVIRGGNILKDVGNFGLGVAGNDQGYFTPQDPTPSSLPNPLTWMLHRMGVGQ